MSLNSSSIFIFVLKALREKSKRNIMRRSDAMYQYRGKLRKIKFLVLIFSIFRYNGGRHAIIIYWKTEEITYTENNVNPKLNCGNCRWSEHEFLGSRQ